MNEHVHTRVYLQSCLLRQFLLTFASELLNISIAISLRPCMRVWTDHLLFLHWMCPLNIPQKHILWREQYRCNVNVHDSLTNLQKSYAGKCIIFLADSLLLQDQKDPLACVNEDGAMLKCATAASQLDSSITSCLRQKNKWKNTVKALKSIRCPKNPIPDEFQYCFIFVGVACSCLLTWTNKR